MQIESSDATLQDIGPDPSSEGKGTADTGSRHSEDRGEGDEDGTATSARGVRDSSKRTADTAGLDQGGEGTPRSE